MSGRALLVLTTLMLFGVFVGWVLLDFTRRMFRQRRDEWQWLFPSPREFPKQEVKETDMTGEDKRNPDARKEAVRSGEAAPPGPTVSPGGQQPKPSEDPRKDSGLYELDADGNLVLDADNNPILKSDKPK